MRKQYSLSNLGEVAEMRQRLDGMMESIEFSDLRWPLAPTAAPTNGTSHHPTKKGLDLQPLSTSRSVGRVATFNRRTTPAGGGANPPNRRGFRAALLSRYAREFVHIAQIGKGGFGRVFRALNIVDRREYAVKCISFDHTDSMLCFRVMREVHALAALQHENVVRYFGSWFEVDFEPPVAGTGSPSTTSRQSSHRKRLSTMWSESNTCDTSQVPVRRVVSTPSISFASHSIKEHAAAAGDQNAKLHRLRIETMSSSSDSSSSSSSNSARDGGRLFRRCRSSSLSNNARQSSTRGSHSADRPCLDDQSAAIVARRSAIMGDGQCRFVPPYLDDDDLPLARHFLIYLQMELCERTLREMLLERNECMLPDDTYDCVSPGDNQTIMYQLLRAVEYIHDQNVIHRDIKPSNVFLRSRNGPLHVLLGDFGLACRDAAATEAAAATELDAKLQRQDSHSAGVGTFTYSAPEQLAAREYGNKVDIYSVGVIAYELYQPFSTYMEKAHHLLQLRQHEPPQQFVQRWPKEADVIVRMVAREPSARPSATQILELHGNFASRDQLVNNLERTVRSQRAEITRLRNELTKMHK